MPGVVAYTIISRAYVPHARVLAESYLRQHPEGAFWALLVDDLNEEIEGAKEPFQALRLTDLDMEVAEVHRMAMLFGSRLIAAIKPWVFEHFLAAGAEAVLYIDSDFVAYDRLDEAARMATEHGVLVVPHVIHPVPDDGHLPDETVILGVGTFNAGFFGVGPTSGPFLDFLKDRLRRECHTDVYGMRVNEQRWLDFVPALFDHAVLRDPGVDVAPWNIHERRITRSDGRLLAGGSPLRAFHFSGFDPRVPSVLSARDYWDRPRLPMDADPALVELCDDYRRALLDAGFEESHRTPFAFDFLADGRPIYASLRKLYAAHLIQAEAAGHTLPPDPFDPMTSAAFDRWCAQAYEEAGLAVPLRLRPGASAESPAEDWLGRVIVAPAGHRTPEGVVRIAPETAGVVTLGPYAQLGVGSYRAAVDLRFDHDDHDGHQKPGEAGVRPATIDALQFDVFLDGYVLASTGPGDPGPPILEFTISEDLQQLAMSSGVEIRSRSYGGVAADIEGIMVERTGAAPPGRRGFPDVVEWLPAMVPGGAGRRQGASIAQIDGRTGFVAMGPGWRLAGGRYRADIRLRSGQRSGPAANDQLGLVELAVNDHVLAHRVVDHRASEAGRVTLDFDVTAPWADMRTARAQLRLRADAGSAMELEAVTVRRVGDAEPTIEPDDACDWTAALLMTTPSVVRVGSEIYARSPEPGIIATGPHWRLFEGHYQATVLIVAEGVAGAAGPSGPVATIAVLVDGTTVADRAVPVPATFTGADRDRAQVLDFDVTPVEGSTGQDVELAVSSTGQCPIRVRSALVERVDVR